MTNSSSFDIRKPVPDWKQNIHIAQDPYGLFSGIDVDTDFDERWQRLFSVPYVEQTLSNYDSNPLWLKQKVDFLSASECAAAVEESPYPTDTLEAYIVHKAGIREKTFEEITMRAMAHGKKKEGNASLLYCLDKKQIGFQFGLIPHPTLSFVAVSPDLLCKSLDRIVEIKCPLLRKIIPWDLETLDGLDPILSTEGKYRLDYQTTLLLKEVQASPSDSKRYLSITNLSMDTIHMLNKLRGYWHQVQLQWETIRIGNSVDFLQYGTAPNKFYSNNDLLTVTSVPCDDSWISRYRDKLCKAWDEVLYYRQASHTERQDLLAKVKLQEQQAAEKKSGYRSSSKTVSYSPEWLTCEPFAASPYMGAPCATSPCASVSSTTTKNLSRRQIAKTYPQNVLVGSSVVDNANAKCPFDAWTYYSKNTRVKNPPNKIIGPSRSDTDTFSSSKRLKTEQPTTKMSASPKHTERSVKETKLADSSQTKQPVKPTLSVDLKKDSVTNTEGGEEKEDDREQMLVSCLMHVAESSETVPIV